MLTSRLLKAQLDLGSHRHWLNTFLAQTRRFGPTSPPFYQQFRYSGPALHHDVRTFTDQTSVRKRHGKSSPSVKKLKLQKNQRSDENEATIRALRQAIKDVEIKRVAELYYSLNDKSVIRPNDFRIIAQCLHYSLRAERRSADASTKREKTEELVAFAETLVKDVTGGKLAPHCQAHVHLLGFFKESGVRDAGVRFWRWLELQDDLHVNPDVYGAAIELLAVNGAPLSEMEDTYQQALDRFPGNFSAYHLSPEAIVPERDQSTTLSGTPMLLLQGILTARLLRGDTRNAYLALDTALRLYPDQVPPRFFQLFLEERPLLEAYTVFAIACRGGVIVPTSQFRQLLGVLRTSSDLTTPARHGRAVRSMLTTLYMYVGAGGQATQNVLNELIIAVTQFVRLKGVAELAPKEKQAISIRLMGIVRSLLGIFARFGVTPGITAFNSIITNLGGFGSSKEVINIALVDLERLNLRPNEVTHRSVLTAAGILGDRELVEKAWQGLIEGRAESGRFPDATDFHILIKHAAVNGQIEFARHEYERVKEQLPNSDHNGISTALNESAHSHSEKEGVDPVDPNALFGEIQKVQSDLGSMLGKFEGMKVPDFRNEALPMMLLRTSSADLLPEGYMRGVYNEVTTEQGLSQTWDDVEGSRPTMADPKPLSGSTETHQKPPALSPTNIPFGTLRYENWKTINQLLQLAEASDEAYLNLVDAAIADGVIPPPRRLGLTIHGGVASYGMSDVMPSEEELERGDETLDGTQIMERRSEILRLRGRLQ